ncbi:cupin domain-containing protein [Sporomusa acidovorans]|uniref:Ethanolamine utilization protein EutQ n=1 Tax=Sporomusa acidovorans (strain ATCC 49682 / DSM 3132 / Mol) TaxID=1123286 RepID=A0ABZ3J7B6_SPOA4|nr:cupin domain-containing protein [Sporomusa acidovorans]OZC21236.1 ethanolamine utilization protein EutQ [Sporomusa acidovorans DSM 3132]SDE65608.1 ethanolamine utilization protein EutQ [Sporomusa acidovorans]
MRHFISAESLRKMVEQGKKVTIDKNCVLTPAAQDLVKELGLTVIYGEPQAQQAERQVTGVSPVPPSGVAIHPDAPQELKQKVRQILREILKPACLHPQVVHVRGEQVVIQPFAAAPPGQKIGLTDAVTAREGNLCAGFMTFDHAELPWLLHYDEADYIIEGEFTLKVGEQRFEAKAGDIIYIPKGSQVVFSSPTFCKVFYVTYPANWADLGSQ